MSLILFVLGVLTGVCLGMAVDVCSQTERTVFYGYAGLFTFCAVGLLIAGALL